MNNFSVNPQRNKRIFVVDNFYQDPDSVRALALQQEFFEEPYFIGKRTQRQFLFPGIKESFEDVLGQKITKWEEHGMNGRFQHNVSGLPLVYHCDDQTWAGLIYLTPDAPPQAGTAAYRHKASGVRHNSDPRIMEAFNQKTFLDPTPYEQVDVVGNVYNRLVLFSGGLIHAACCYFGDSKENSRLWHMFFFD